MLQRKNRLKGSSLFKSIRKCGKTFKHPFIILIAAPSSSQFPRIGIAVGRAVGNAVKRNQVKRRIRACVRQMVPTFHGGWDIILIARRPAGQLGVIEIQKALTDLFNRADLFAQPDDRE